MNRLTYMDGGKWRMRIGDTEYSGKEVDRIAAYEETGMEPEDILSAMDMAKLACALHELNKYKELGDLASLRELVQADRDGRCVVFKFGIGSTVYRTWIRPDGSCPYISVDIVRTVKDMLNAEEWDNAYHTYQEAEKALEECGKGVDNQNSG